MLAKLGFLLAAVLCLAARGAQAEEAVKVQAFATWNFEGTAVRSAPEQVTLVGTLYGPVFIESGQGPVYAGQVLCPGTLTIEMADARQVGEGVCAFRAKDGAEAFGRWSCSGYHLVGCKGTFEFTGGTDRLAGIIGGSSLLLRGELLESAQSTGPVAAERAIGVMVWRDLMATVPAKE
jgi:hypothetical protein